MLIFLLFHLANLHHLTLNNVMLLKKYFVLFSCLVVCLFRCLFVCIFLFGGRGRALWMFVFLPVIIVEIYSTAFHDSVMTTFIVINIVSLFPFRFCSIRKSMMVVYRWDTWLISGILKWGRTILIPKTKQNWWWVLTTEWLSEFIVQNALCWLGWNRTMQ